MPINGSTVKQMLDRVLGEAGLLPGLAYATATEDTERKAFYMLQRAAVELGRIDWPPLLTEATITLVADDYDYALPADFGRVTADSIWEQGGRREVQLPTAQRTWRYLEATSLQSGLTLRGKIIGNQLHLNRVEAGEVLSYEYVSSHLALDSDGSTTKRIFDADDDTYRCDDECLILLAKAKLMRQLGLGDWQVAERDYLRQLSYEKGTFQGKRTVSTLAGEDFTIDPHFDDWVNP